MQFFKSSLFTFVLLFSAFVSAEDETQPTVQVATAFINMHSGPSSESPIFYVAEKDEWLTVLSRRTGFFKIKSSDGTTGWIAEKQLNNTLDVNGKPVSVSASGISGFLEKFN